MKEILVITGKYQDGDKVNLKPTAVLQTFVQAIDNFLILNIDNMQVFKSIIF